MPDLVLALRLLRKQPSYAAVAILTLAIGIAGATAIFSILNAVVLRPLPYPEADRLAIIRDAAPPRFPEFSLSPGRFLEWQSRTHVFEAIAATRNDAVSLTGRGDPRRLTGALVTASLFAVGGVAPVKGRTFTAEEDRVGGPRVAVISDALWHSLFDGRDDALGQTLLLDDTPTTIVGIMPATFTLPNSNVQLWRPMAFTERERSTYGSHYLGCLARLRRGVTFETARQDLLRAARDIEFLSVDGTANKGWTAVIFPLQEYAVRNVSRGLIVLSVAVALVLLIACANVANLLFARGISRQREIGLRAALGANRARLIRQMLVENLVVGIVASAIGLIGAIALVRWVAASPTANLPRAGGIAIDQATLALAIALAALTPLIFGLLPALHASRVNLTALLGDRTGASHVRGRTRAALIVGEVALAVVLVQGSGLLIRSFDRLMRVSPGFDPEGAVVVTISLPATRYRDNAAKVAFWSALDDRAAALPGVEAVGLAQSFPFISDHVAALYIAGVTPDDPSQQPSTNFYAVTPGYFKAMRIPILKGRGILASDTAAGQRVCVISKTLADRWFAGEDPIGKRLKVSQGPSNDGSTIVGVAGDIKQYGLDRETTLQVYESIRQHPYFGGMTLVVRTAAGAAETTTALRTLLKELDPALPIASARRLTTLVDLSVGPRRLTAALLGGFAGVALLLSAIGIFGLVSFLVSQRTQEIGIRVALGAAPNRVLALVFTHGLGLTAIGVAVGMTAGLGTAKWLRAELFEITPTDPVSLLLAPAALIAAAAVACYWPARRALKVNPIDALRQA
jgi:putative ABC transport system permease protein